MGDEEGFILRESRGHRKVRTEEREAESGGSVADPQVDAGIGTVAGK